VDGSFISRSRKVAQSRVAQIQINTPFTQLAMDESVPELRVVGYKRDLDSMKDVSGVPKFNPRRMGCPLIRIAEPGLRLKS
jgi:hypothetical protein